MRSQRISLKRDIHCNLFLSLLILLILTFVFTSTSYSQGGKKQRGDRSKIARTAPPKVKVLKGNGKALYLLGTVHFHHMWNPNFTWPHFDKIVSLISPELILVEIKPEHFKPKEYLDGPIEMAYFVHLASMKKIECQGINWAPDEWLFDFSKVDWDYRNDQQAQLIMKAVKETNANVTLVVVGEKNIKGIISRLKKNSYSEQESPQWNLTVDEYPDIPEAVMNMWKEGVKYLSEHPTAKTFKIKNTIKSLKQAIQAGGYQFERNKK